MKFTDYFLLLKFVSLFSLEMANQKQRFFLPIHYLNFIVSSKFEKLCKFEKKIQWFEAIQIQCYSMQIRYEKF